MAGRIRVGRGGLEPPRPCGQQILSLSRLPFRHQPSYIYFNKKRGILHYFCKHSFAFIFPAVLSRCKICGKIGFLRRAFLNLPAEGDRPLPQLRAVRFGLNSPLVRK